MKTYQISQWGNKPTLFVDGKKTAPVLYALSDFPAAAANTAYAQKNIAAFAKAGVNLVAADIGLHLGWRKTEPFDTDGLIAELSAVLDANPNARILLRLHMNPPYWWMRDHPEECIVYRTEKGDLPGIDNGEQDRLIRNDHNLHLRVSLSSQRWLKEAAENMEIFLRELEGTPEGDALMALQVACGVNGEWHQWGCDVGLPIQMRFRRYLKETYQTEENLRRAWHDPSVTFETARFSPETFQPADEGCWLDPRYSQRIIDSQMCVQLAPPEAISYFCRAAKKIRPDMLCGAFYAYYLGTGGVIGGHLLPKRLYDDPHVDFLCGPFCYFPESRKSEGATIQRTLLESHRLRNMLWLTEMDQRPIGLEYCDGGDPACLDETRAILRRCVLQPLLAGEGFWYYDHRLVPSMVKMLGGQVRSNGASLYRKTGWWEAETSQKEIARIQKLAQKIAEAPYQGAADVLLVYDTYKFCRTQSGEETVMLHHALTRSGVVFDCIYESELALCDLERYRCIIFVDCHQVTENQRALHRACAQGHMVIHLDGHGYCDGRSLAEENLSRTVGMRMEKTEAAHFLLGDETILLNPACSPCFCVQDDQAEALAHYDNGKTAIAIKGNDIYIPVQYVPRALVKPLMKRAGVHIWCDSDEPVIAGAGYVAVNCQRAGKRTLFLPNGREIPVESDGYLTPVFHLDTGEQVL